MPVILAGNVILLLIFNFLVEQFFVNQYQDIILKCSETFSNRCGMETLKSQCSLNQFQVLLQRKVPSPQYVNLQRRCKQGTVAEQNPASFSKQRLTYWLPAYDIFVLRFRPKKKQFSVALPTPQLLRRLRQRAVQRLKRISQSSRLHSKKIFLVGVCGLFVTDVISEVVLGSFWLMLPVIFVKIAKTSQTPKC